MSVARKRDIELDEWLSNASDDELESRRKTEAAECRPSHMLIDEINEELRRRAVKRVMGELPSS